MLSGCGDVRRRHVSGRMPGGAVRNRRLCDRSGRTLRFVAAVLWVCLQSSAYGQDVPAGRRRPTLEDGIGHAMPTWLSLSGEFRTRYENRQSIGFVKDQDDGYPLIRTRLDVGIQASSWLRFGFQGQDARAPGIRDVPTPGAFRDGFDLRQAYVELGGSTSPVSVTAGRQLLLLGDQRLVGALDWANTARVFDAVRLQVRVRGAKADIFSASVVRNDPFRRVNISPEGSNLHGIYASLDRLAAWATVEPYVLWQTNPAVVNELGVGGDLDRFTTGVRVWAKGLGPWDYNAAIVGQRGDAAGAVISAWGYYAELGYSIDAAWKPRPYVEYNFGSGDENPEDGRVGGFVDLYPTAHLWYGFTDQEGWRNLKNIRIGLDLAPRKKLQMKFDFHSFWLATARDGLYNVGGRLLVAAPEQGAAATKVGDELNAIFTVPYSDILKFGGGIGHLFPGPFVKQNSSGFGHTFSYLFVSYRF